MIYLDKYLVDISQEMHILLLLGWVSINVDQILLVVSGVN